MGKQPEYGYYLLPHNNEYMETEAFKMGVKTWESFIKEIDSW